MVMEQAKTNLIDRHVCLIKTDGFKKIGILRGSENGMVTLELLNGKFESIPLVQISTIVDVGDENGNGK